MSPFPLLRRTIVGALITALSSATLLTGCSSGREPMDPGGPLAANQGPAFLSGRITRVGHPWGYLVSGTPGTNYRVTEAFFTVGEGTVIRHANGGAATVADLTVGRSVQLWITGVILESLPVQVAAATIVIEP